MKLTASKIKIVLFSILLMGLIISFSGKKTWAKDCSDEGVGYACRDPRSCEPGTETSFLCSPAEYVCCKKIKDCSEYGTEYGCYFYDDCNTSTIVNALCGGSLGGSKVCCKKSSTAASGGLTFENPLGQTSDIWELIIKIIDFIFNVAVFVTAIIIVYAGFLFITSSGEPEKLKTAQKVLIWALIGFGLILLAKAIPPFIYEFLTGKQMETTNTNTTAINCSRCSNIYPCRWAKWTVPPYTCHSNDPQKCCGEDPVKLKIPVQYNINDTCTELCLKKGQICEAGECVSP
ncbi:MAG TPA: pilin [Candidatus Paceibacterota bacterium]|nr:pilin [Candidatus Paceibacterota bacterium]